MTSLEQMIEAAKRLPPQDRRSLQQWLEQQERLDVEEQQKATRLQQELEQYQRAKQWIAEHRAEYLGQWVALEGDQLISAGANAKEVDAAARAAGIKVPFVVRIVAEEPKFYYSGW